MRGMMGVTALALGAAFGLSAAANAGPVSYGGPISVTYYNDFVENPGVGISFSDPFATDTITAINETRDYGGTDTDPSWPSGSELFGADFTGTLDVASSGVYKLGFASDDAGYVFVNGTLVHAEPGPNSLPPLAYFPVSLVAGSNSFEIQYDNDECCQAAVRLSLAVPEPATWAMMLVGFGGLGAAMRSNRRRQAVGA